jgi:pentatricopeptide repeat protein
MYTSAINACAKKGEVNTACRLFRQSEVEDGLQPDVFMYCALMKVFRQAIANSLKRDTSGEDNQSEALLEEALKYVDHMKEEGIVGDTVLYNCLISTCGRARQLEEAEKFFWEMQKLEVQPNSKTYSILIHACLSSREGDKALSYFRDAREQSGMINAHLGAQAIQAHGMLESEDREETLEQAVELYKELDIEGIQMDGVAAASLISLAGDLGYHQKALEILNTQIFSSSAYRERLPPEPFAVAAAMCAKQSDIEGAKGILAHIQTHSTLIPNHELGASLIDAFSKVGDLVTSFEVLELLLSRGCSPNSYSFSGLLYACACAGLPVLALRLYELAKKTGAVPNTDCLYGTWCSSVLHSFLKTRREGHIDEENVYDMEYIQRITGVIEERLRVLSGGKKASQEAAAAANEAEAEFGERSESQMTKDEIVAGIKELYRDALDKGYKPSVKVLDMILECLCTNLYLEKIQKVTNDPIFAYEAPIADVSQGAGLFETSAFALFEEAGELGVLPSCVSQSDLEIKIDFRELTPVVSEVCLLVLLRSLKRRWDSSQGKHEFKSILMILPVQKEEALEQAKPLVDRKVKSLLRHVGMEYVMIDREDRYDSDSILLIVRPKTIKACLSGQFDTVHDMYDSITKQSSVRMEYYTESEWN